MKKALSISDQIFTSAFENASIGIGITGLDGKWKRVNQSFCKMLGYSKEELLTKSFAEITCSDDKTADLAAYQRFLNSEIQGYQREKRYLHKQGHVVWAQVNVCVVPDSDHKPFLFISNIQDITERKNSETALHESLDSFRILSEVMPQLVWNTSVDGFTTYYNQQWTDYIEFDPKLSFGENWAQSLHPDDRAATVNAWNCAVENGENLEIEIRLRKYDGSYKWWLSRGVPVKDEAGQVTKWVGTCTDIDELKRALDKAKTREEIILSQAALINQASDAIIMLSLDGEIQTWNKGAERLYGWTSAETVGQKDIDLYDKSSEVYREMIRCLLRDDHWKGELCHRTCSGAEVYVESRLTLTRDHINEAKSILVINTDITEKRRNQIQVLRSQRLESIGTLAGGIAHDLNNLLAPIMLSIELLEIGETNIKRLKTLETIASCAKRGADVIKLVLSFARGVEGERVDLQPETILRETVKIIEDTFLKSIQVECVMSPDLWPISGDETQLQQVLLNLSVNARDAMPSGGKLTLSIENTILDKKIVTLNGDCKPGNYVQIRIEDTGTGMPKATLDRAFEPFFTTKELGQGTGLGLSTSLAIIGSHKGFIGVYSEVGVGTRFSIYLPAIETKNSTRQPANLNNLLRGSGEWILVVDDEPAIRLITRETLEAFGYRVRLASGGAEAIEVYTELGQEIAIVLIDIMMPVVNGILTIKELRKINPDVRIIAASGLASNEKAAAAIVFLSKPYTTEVLLKGVSDCINRV